MLGTKAKYETFLYILL